MLSDNSLREMMIDLVFMADSDNFTISKLNHIAVQTLRTTGRTGNIFISEYNAAQHLKWFPKIKLSLGESPNSK